MVKCDVVWPMELKAQALDLYACFISCTTKRNRRETDTNQWQGC